MANISINVNLIKKEELVERTYVKEGNTVTEKILKLETRNIKVPKVITEGETWKLVKTGFVTQARTKEERLNKIVKPIIGEVMEIQDKENTAIQKEAERIVYPEGYPVNEIRVEDVPF